MVTAKRKTTSAPKAPKAAKDSSDTKPSLAAQRQPRKRIAPGAIGLAPYSERLAGFLAGDQDQIVSPQFRQAVEALGRAPVDLNSLSWDEKLALVGRDLRWEKGPDGVLLWTSAALQRTDPQNLPTFEWLTQAAYEKLRESEGARQTPEWVPGWSEEWGKWAYRFVSLKYDSAFKQAQSKGIKKLLTAAGNSAAGAVASLKTFLLEYLPQSSISACRNEKAGGAHDSWMMPQNLLDAAHHGEHEEYRDDFWNRCCAPLRMEYETTGGRRQFRNPAGATLSSDVQDFLDFVADRLMKEVAPGGDPRYQNPFLPRNSAGILLVPNEAMSEAAETTAWVGRGYVVPTAASADRDCTWIGREYPKLKAWEPFAKEYLGQIKSSVPLAITGLQLFIGRYLATAGQVGEPGENLDPQVAMRPIPDASGSEALLLKDCRQRLGEPQALLTVSEAQSKSALRTVRDGFIPFILNHYCSDQDGDHVTLAPGFYNPFASIEMDDKKGGSRTESSRGSDGALPSSYIRRLRNMIAQGPHFCDWQWAQQALHNSQTGTGSDWFEVDRSRVDPNDPDCVWRIRETITRGEVCEIWSPVRWVALIAKLNTALRTLQVRMLDSGESDALRFDLRQWSRQTYPDQTRHGSNGFGSEQPQGPIKTPLGADETPWVDANLKSRNPGLYKAVIPENAARAKGRRGDPKGWNNGVLRPEWVYNDDRGRRELNTFLYINTNKTADAQKEGAAKGFEVPFPMKNCPLPPDEQFWVRQGEGQGAAQMTFASTRQKQDWLDDLGENVHWWLAKLRDWQEKYNPIERRVHWKELQGTLLLGEKTDEQYDQYRPACFLFREPAARSEKHPGPAYPLTDGTVANAWWALLKELQDQLNAQRAEGTPEHRLVVRDDNANKTCHFDLHSIRVSIITMLITEGKVPPQYVQALVGHSRLVMTLYYTVINPVTMAKEIRIGFQRAKDAEVEAEKRFLESATVEELREKAAFNDPESALAALGAPRSTGVRNSVIWVRKLGGICPVGGVTHDTEGGLPAGCFNGGPVITQSKKASGAKHAEVTGGPGTCVNCRWFITKSIFVPELHAIAEGALYRVQEYKDKSLEQQKVIDEIKDRYEAIELTQKGVMTPEQTAAYNREMDDAERIRDGYMESSSVALFTSANAHRLIQRALHQIDQEGNEQEGALITSGTTEDMKVSLQSVNSAMLQAVRVSMHAEIHPEMNEPSAILRAARVVARKLHDEDIDPFALLDLPEGSQAKVVNALTRHIASLCNAEDPNKDPNVGLSQAIALIESNAKLSHVLGVPPKRLDEWVQSLPSGKSLPLPSPQGFQTTELLGHENKSGGDA